MESPLSVLASAERIVSESRHVTVPVDGIEATAQVLCDAICDNKYSTRMWNEHPLHPDHANEDAIAWIFLIDTLNFSFWSDEGAPAFSVWYQGKEHTGYWSLCAAVNRCLDEGLVLTDARVMAELTLDQVAHVFRSHSGTCVPMLEQRLQVLRETGRVLLDHWNGSFVHVVQAAHGSAQQLVRLVCQWFPSYRDVHDWPPHGDATDAATVRVSILKRAQILVADVWACFDGQGLGCFDDIDTITMFADYRVPQSLVHFNCLKYSSELHDHLCQPDAQAVLPSGHRYELEIRAASIWSVELLVRAVKALLHSRTSDDEAGTTKHRVNAILVDFYLWDTAKQYSERMDHIPIHKVRSIYY